MNGLDLLAVGAFAVVSAAFWLAGDRTLVFASVFLATLLAFAGLLPTDATSFSAAGAWLCVAGLALLFLGLLIARIMIHRSVSLRLLAQLAQGPLAGPWAGPAAERMRGDVEKRILELSRYRLAEPRGEVLRLTKVGRLVGIVVALGYAAFRVRR